MRFARIPPLAALLALASCTVLRVEAEDGPRRLESEGLLDAHLAIGIPEQEGLLNIDLFDGRSPGALAEISIWKLLRLEAGLAGFDIGIGPLDVGLGVLGYHPRTWLETEDRAPQRTESGRARPAQEPPQTIDDVEGAAARD